MEFVLLNMDMKVVSRLKAGILTWKRRNSGENALAGGREMSIITVSFSVVATGFDLWLV